MIEKVTKISRPTWFKKLTGKMINEQTNVGLFSVHNKVVDTEVVESEVIDSVRTDLAITENDIARLVFNPAMTADESITALGSKVANLSKNPAIRRFLSSKLGMDTIIDAAYTKSFMEPLTRAGIMPQAEKVIVILTPADNDAISIRVISHITQLAKIEESKPTRFANILRNLLPGSAKKKRYTNAYAPAEIKSLIHNPQKKALISFDTLYIVKPVAATQVQISVKEHYDVVRHLSVDKYILPHLPNFKPSFSKRLSLFGRWPFRYQEPPKLHAALVQKQVTETPITTASKDSASSEFESLTINPAEIKDTIAILEIALQQLRNKNYFAFIIEVNRLTANIASKLTSMTIKLTASTLPEVINSALKNSSFCASDYAELTNFNNALYNAQVTNIIGGGATMYNISALYMVAEAQAKEASFQALTATTQEVDKIAATIVNEFNSSQASFLKKDIETFILSQLNGNQSAENVINKIKACSYNFDYLTTDNLAATLSALKEEISLAKSSTRKKHTQLVYDIAVTLYKQHQGELVDAKPIATPTASDNKKATRRLSRLAFFSSNKSDAAVAKPVAVATPMQSTPAASYPPKRHARNIFSTLLRFLRSKPTKVASTPETNPSGNNRLVPY